MTVSTTEKLLVDIAFYLSILVGLTGSFGIVVFQVVLRLAADNRLVDVSGCLVASGLIGLAMFTLPHILLRTRR